MFMVESQVITAEGQKLKNKIMAYKPYGRSKSSPAKMPWAALIPVATQAIGAMSKQKQKADQEEQS